jgi:hypothetical protein
VRLLPPKLAQPFRGCSAPGTQAEKPLTIIVHPFSRFSSHEFAHFSTIRPASERECPPSHSAGEPDQLAESQRGRFTHKRTPAFRSPVESNCPTVSRLLTETSSSRAVEPLALTATSQWRRAASEPDFATVRHDAWEDTKSHPVTLMQRVPVTWPPTNYDDCTATGKKTMTFRTHQWECQTRPPPAPLLAS